MVEKIVLTLALGVAVGILAFAVGAALVRGSLFGELANEAISTVQERLDLPRPTATSALPAFVVPAEAAQPTATIPSAVSTSETVAELCASPNLRRAESSMADLAEARSSHEYWADYVRENPSYPYRDQVGDVSHHLRWIGRYDRAIAVLRGYVEGCGGLDRVSY